MRHRTCANGLVLAVLLGAGCTARPIRSEAGCLDSAALAAGEGRRRAFLAEQEEQIRELLRVRPLWAEVVLTRPTVVAFHPVGEAGLDSVASRQRLNRYEALAKAAGWTFEERHSGTLRLTDPGSHALYSLPVSRERVPSTLHSGQ